MPSTTTLEAERADRISRLAGLERVSAVRPSNTNTSQGGPSAAAQIPGYFDANGNPQYTTKMSTVGSASATGSSGGQTTTWASGSLKQDGDDDEMSMDAREGDDDRDRYSTSAMDEDFDGDRDVDGMSDNTSLVGFGEGAGSTVSGPTYSRSNLVPRSGFGNFVQPGNTSTPTTPLSASASVTADQPRADARMTDGLAGDTGSGYLDTAARGGGVPAGASASGVETAERIIRESLDNGDGRKPPLGSPDEGNLR
jgi:hypothetical protein